MKSMADEEKELGDAGHQSAGKTLRDPRVIGFGLVYFGITYGLYALSFFLPSIVAGFKQTFDTDFSPVETGLIVAVPYAIGAVAKIGRASCRERVCQYVEISVVAVSLKKKKTTNK